MNKAALLLIALLATPSLGAQPVRIESPGYSLERTIGREPLDPSRLPEGATISHLPWREFQVEVVKVPEVVEGQNVINRNVMLPLKPSAIQLRMVGVADLDAEMDALLPQILATVEGDTNWLTSEERAGKLGQSVGAVVGVALAIGLFLYFRARNRRAPKP